MKKQKEFIDLSIKTLQILGRWAADCAQRAIPIYEELYKGDTRPRDAITGIRVFADGGKRIAKLRVLAMDAYRASRDTNNTAASAAAQSASLAAASAYTHPFIDVNQAKHILGPAAYAALAIEIKSQNDAEYGDAEVRLAVEQAPMEVCELLRKMPHQPEGKTRLDRLMFDLDAGLRNNNIHPLGGE
jgi:hypothetical protein